MESAFVISNAVRNLVLHLDVSYFSRYGVTERKVSLGCWRTRFLTAFEMTGWGDVLMSYI